MKSIQRNDSHMLFAQCLSVSGKIMFQLYGHIDVCYVGCIVELYYNKLITEKVHMDDRGDKRII